VRRLTGRRRRERDRRSARDDRREGDRSSMVRFGAGLKPFEAIARELA